MLVDLSRTLELSYNSVGTKHLMPPAFPEVWERENLSRQRRSQVNGDEWLARRSAHTTGASALLTLTVPRIHSLWVEGREPENCICRVTLSWKPKFTLAFIGCGILRGQLLSPYSPFHVSVVDISWPLNILFSFLVAIIYLLGICLSTVWDYHQDTCPSSGWRVDIFLKPVYQSLSLGFFFSPRGLQKGENGCFSILVPVGRYSLRSNRKFSLCSLFYSDEQYHIPYYGVISNEVTWTEDTDRNAFNALIVPNVLTQ